MIGLTQQRLRELLDYDPATGVFRWRKTYSKAKAGEVAGTTKGQKGYRKIGVCGEVHGAHRLAFGVPDVNCAATNQEQLVEWVDSRCHSEAGVVYALKDANAFDGDRDIDRPNSPCHNPILQRKNARYATARNAAEHIICKC